MKIIISNIQRFCLHDGPGIRTTVFLKGCNLKCPWCSNPENIDFKMQEYTKNGISKTYGREIELNELKKEILKDKVFFENDGGVTFSGGEPLLHMITLEPMLKELKNENINMCVETSLATSQETVNIAVKYIDLFYIDIKIIDKSESYKLALDVDLYLNNLKSIFEKRKKVIFRIPLVPNYTYTESNINEILDLLKKYKPLKVEMFKLHKLGLEKYLTLNKEIIEFEDIKDCEIELLKSKIEQLGIDVNICKL